MKSKEYFYSLADRLNAQIDLNSERFSLYYSGEISDFVRFNHSKIRQAGHVEQAYLDLTLTKDSRQCSGTMTLSGDKDHDGTLLENLLGSLRKKVKSIPKDPYCLWPSKVNSSEHVQENNLPPAQRTIESIVTKAQDLDLVGIYAQGKVERGFSNSDNQRNWFSKSSFNLDYSAYLKEDKAVKSSYSGFDFNDAHLMQELELVRHKLDVLKKPSKSLKPGSYKAYLAPSAVYELLNMLSWGGFSEKALRSKHSCLNQLREKSVKLSPMLSIYENTQKGTGPLFGEEGFVKPENQALISRGELVHTMISPRTAKEYGLETNGANAGESPEAYEILPGNLARENILAELGEGLFISNLWYLNFSDRMQARITGMTRFASFWVQKGELQAPLNVMRFDDSLLNLFGSKLLALTKQLDFIMDPGTYETRSTASAHVPGMLVSGLNLTL